jgi:hypothetical protein
VGGKMKKLIKPLGETTKTPNPPTHERHLCVEYHHSKPLGEKKM